MARRRVGAVVVAVLVLLGACELETENPSVTASALPPPAAPTGSPAGSPPPTGRGGSDVALFRGRLPRCERVPRPRAPGMIAAAGPARVHLVTPTGDGIASLPAGPPVGWSPSGRLLATGRYGDLWTADGDAFPASETQHAFVSNRRLSWAWSPVADCALALDEDGVLSLVDADTRGAPQTYGQVVVEGGAESFAWSPDGRRFAVVVRGRRARSILVARFPRPRWQLAKRFWPRTCCVTLGGWSPDGRDLLYWAGPGVSAMADGWKLRSVTGAGVYRWGATLPTPGVLAQCGERLVGLLGGDRTGQGSRLAVLHPLRRPEPFTERSVYRHPTCSEGGQYVAVSRDGRLAIFRPDGSVVGSPTPDDFLTELGPEWGPAGSGLLLVRQAHVFRQLWFAPEGGRADLTAALYPGGDHPLRSLFDWSATRPAGVAP